MRNGISVVTTEGIITRMIRHILLVTFKQGITETEIKSTKKGFLDIPSKIPGISSVEWGVNDSPEGKNSGFTHSVLMTFENEAIRSEYLDHPEHVALKNIFRPFVDKIIVFDYSI
ncbi:MAG: hypothetical protein ACI93R_004037 [Flavobacteriales bacterium]